MQLAPNAVNGSNVADGSLTSVDLLDAPRAAFASGNQSASLTSTDTVVRSVTLTAPAAGRVIVNASGSFRFADAIDDDGVQCSITTGTTLQTSRLIVAQEVGIADMRFVPFAGTRGFNVGAGPVTINLVCNEFTGDVFVEDTNLTAIFIGS